MPPASTILIEYWGLFVDVAKKLDNHTSQRAQFVNAVFRNVIQAPESRRLVTARMGHNAQKALYYLTGRSKQIERGR